LLVSQRALHDDSIALHDSIARDELARAARS
jgi:hypothetical protein